MSDTDKPDFVRQFVLKQLKEQLDAMQRVQITQLWEAFVKPEAVTVEQMRKEIYDVVSKAEVEVISQILLANPVRKPRGMNGGRKKRTVERNEDGSFRLTIDETSSKAKKDVVKPLTPYGEYETVMVASVPMPKRDKGIKLD